MGVAAVQTSLIERVKAQAPYFPRCSDDKTAKRVRPVEHAVHQPYMQINRKDMKSWLVFDLDHDNPFIEVRPVKALNLATSNVTD